MASLDRDLRALGSRLVLRRGAWADVLSVLARETGAGTVFWTRRYEPWAVKQELKAFQLLNRLGLRGRRFTGGLLFEPQDIATQSGEPFRVFGDFAKACRTAPMPDAPLGPPGSLAPPPDDLASEDLDDGGPQPATPDWAAGLRACWRPGETAALARLATFAEAGMADYAAGRDRPDLGATSRLSPHLHFGELSPRAAWHAAQEVAAAGEASEASGAETFARELLWREFCHHLLFHFPSLPASPLRHAFGKFPWRDDPEGVKAWQHGLTGYPIVDAGMRQLSRTGWMHNRVRMVAASFLVKHLLVPWQSGADWFWETLVDASLANNAANWQWVAGCGADAAPYFRIFNPVLQGKKCDPEGAYVRQWVPELNGLPARHIHAPWTAKPDALQAAGVRLGETYPMPLVDHAEARKRALEAFAVIKARA